jgi:hypothetical protein
MIKKILWLLLTVLLIFSMSACTNGGETPDKTAAAQETMQSLLETTEAPAPTADEATLSPETTEIPAPAAEESNAALEEKENKMKLQIGNNEFTTTLADNSSADALLEMLAEGPITIDMRDYGNMEKVGRFETGLPRNDEQITTAPGDLILYQGNAFVIYYAPNSWNFTRLGKIDDVTAADLKAALGSGNITVTLSLN